VRASFFMCTGSRWGRCRWGCWSWCLRQLVLPKQPMGLMPPRLKSTP